MQLAGIIKENSSEIHEKKKDPYQPEYDDLENLANWYKELLQKHGSWDEAFPHGKTDVIRVLNRMNKEDSVYLKNFIRRHGQDEILNFIKNLIQIES